MWSCWIGLTHHQVFHILFFWPPLYLFTGSISGLHTIISIKNAPEDEVIDFPAPCELSSVCCCCNLTTEFAGVLVPGWLLVYVATSGWVSWSINLTKVNARMRLVNKPTHQCVDINKKSFQGGGSCSVQTLYSTDILPWKLKKYDEIVSKQFPI